MLNGPVEVNAVGVVVPTLPPIVQNSTRSPCPSASVVVTFVSPRLTVAPATPSSLSKLVTKRTLCAPVVTVSLAKFTSPNFMSYPSFCTKIIDELSLDKVAVIPVVVV